MKPAALFIRNATLLHAAHHTGRELLPRARLSGFSLIELIVTIIIVGILAAIAIPSFTNFVANQRVKTASFDLMSTLTLARSEALKRNANVTISSAAGADWEGGWSVSGGGTTLSVHDPMPGISITGPAAGVVYAGNGRATAAATFQVSSPSSTNVRCISIDLSGRPNSKAGAC